MHHILTADMLSWNDLIHHILMADMLSWIDLIHHILMLDNLAYVENLAGSKGCNFGLEADSIVVVVADYLAYWADVGVYSSSLTGFGYGLEIDLH